MWQKMLHHLEELTHTTYPEKQIYLQGPAVFIIF